MSGFIERDQWKTFLDEFSKRNQFRPTRLEVIGREIGAQEDEEFVPLLGVSLETKGTAAGNVEILLAGQTANDPRHLERMITDVRYIAPLLGTTCVEDGLGFEDTDGTKTLLHFEKMPELPEQIH